MEFQVAAVQILLDEWLSCLCRRGKRWEGTTGSRHYNSWLQGKSSACVNRSTHSGSSVLCKTIKRNESLKLGGFVSLAEPVLAWSYKLHTRRYELRFYIFCYQSGLTGSDSNSHTFIRRKEPILTLFRSSCNLVSVNIKQR